MSVTRLPAATASIRHSVVDGVLSALIPLLAVVAGAIHLVHNYLPMEAPRGAGGPPPAGGGPSGVMGLVGPHLTELFVLNFLAYVVLAGLFVALGRLRPRVRVAVDLLLVVLSAATLAIWNTMGRANPAGLGTWALLAEAGLIVLAVVDAIRIQRSTF